MKRKQLIRCTRCLYDIHTPSISFDGSGVCSYCHLHDQLEREYSINKAGEKKLTQLIQQIKVAGAGNKYDCVLGVSGGCDSSYLLYRLKQLHLRPLAVHFDNTWNSAKSTINLYKILKALQVDLYTHVVDNKEYDDMYRSFIKAGVPDLEAPTDIGIATTLYLAAEKYGIKYIIDGHSFRTEGISPLGWLYFDGKYIDSIQKQFGSVKLHTFPNLWMSRFLKWTIINRFKRVRPLYYINYHKEDAKKLLSTKFGWQWYGGHHLENRFTAFYHSYFLPKRFGIDQRPNGYSALVRSGQMKRSEGLRLLAVAPVCNPEIVEMVKKRLGFSESEFTYLMNAPRKTYRDYRTYKHTFEQLQWLFWLLYKFDLVPKSFYFKYTKKQ